MLYVSSKISSTASLIASRRRKSLLNITEEAHMSFNPGLSFGQRLTTDNSTNCSLLRSQIFCLRLRDSFGTTFSRVFDFFNNLFVNSLHHPAQLIGCRMGSICLVRVQRVRGAGVCFGPTAEDITRFSDYCNDVQVVTRQKLAANAVIHQNRGVRRCIIFVCESCM